MNWVLVIVLLTLALCVIHGYCRGFLRIAYSLVAWLIALAFVSWATPYISQFLVENTGIYEQVEAHCEEWVRQSAAEQIQTETGKMTSETESGKQELADLGLKLPDALLDGILEKTAGTADELLEQAGVYTQIAQELAGFVVQGISFVAALILAGLLLGIIQELLGIVSRIPVLKGVNRFLGTFAGAIQALLIIWIVFYIIALCSAGSTGRVLVSYIYESPFLIFLYENNLVLTIILSLF
ncbi:MAG: CvpA family protein [Roseburia sp.]|nr:CvpA family protein [Roseburia sp.]